MIFNIKILIYFLLKSVSSIKELIQNEHSLNVYILTRKISSHSTRTINTFLVQPKEFKIEMTIKKKLYFLLLKLVQLTNHRKQFCLCPAIFTVKNKNWVFYYHLKRSFKTKKKQKTKSGFFF